MAIYRGGYTGTILRINLTRGEIRKEPLPEAIIRDYIGGRGFAAKVMFDEVPPETDAFSEQNKLIFSVGPLVGIAPSGSRVTASAISPLSGLYGDSNAGGFWGPELKFAGYDGIIFEGKALSPVYLLIDNDRVELKDASNLWGQDIYTTHHLIQEEYGSSVHTVAIGPAAENKVRFAGILVDAHHAFGRMGMGAVMASKNLKCIVTHGQHDLEIVDQEAYKETVLEYLSEIRSDPSSKRASTLGTPGLIMMLQNWGCLQTNNQRTAVFEYAEEISGERVRAEYTVKDAGCYGCMLRCSAVEKRYLGKRPEYETLQALGSICGVGDLEDVLEASHWADHYGVDTISIGKTISFAMELYEEGILKSSDLDGLELSFGNGKGMIAMIHKICTREGCGNLFADGVARASRQIGEASYPYAMVVKNVEIPSTEPRGEKGRGLGYLTSTRGPDHLRSLPFAERILKPEEAKRLFGHEDASRMTGAKGKGNMVKWSEDFVGLSDMLGICKLGWTYYSSTMPRLINKGLTLPSRLFQAITGMELTEKELSVAAERVTNLERAYLTLQGISRKDEVFPDRITKEPLPEGPSKGSVHESDLMLDEYFKARGWAVETGIPKEETLRRLGLEVVIAKYKAKGLL